MTTGIDVSVIIPSRQPQYLNKTVYDVLGKAEGSVEVVVVLDGYWTADIIEDDRVTYLHHGTVHDSYGMREAINLGVRLSRGTYLMKLDEHCMMDEGWDTKLRADMQDNWVVIPRRYRLDPEKWELIQDGRPPIDYMYLAYPYERPFDKTCGLHGAEWRQRYHERQDKLIDDTMSWQGSCWFMKRTWWDFLGELDDEQYGQFTQEAQEIGNKTWLSDGRLVVNKKTWYAHFHKGKRGKGYGFSNKQYDVHMEGTERGRVFCIDYWMNNKWERRKHDFEWLLQKFWPVPTWSPDWRERIEVDKLQDYSRLKYEKQN
jgi:hypothetical protein